MGIYPVEWFRGGQIRPNDLVTQDFIWAGSITKENFRSAVIDTSIREKRYYEKNYQHEIEYRSDPFYVSCAYEHVLVINERFKDLIEMNFPITWKLYEDPRPQFNYRFEGGSFMIKDPEDGKLIHLFVSLRPKEDYTTRLLGMAFIVSDSKVRKEA